MYKVLLVEDEAIIRGGLKQLIEETIGGFQVAEAASGREALEALEALETAEPDLILTDIRMEGMSGLDMIGRIRERHPDLPVMIISGYADFEYAKQAIKYGVRDYLLKPIDRVELTQTLHRFRKQREEGRSEDAGGGGDRNERQLIRKVKELIAEHLDKDLSLVYIAERVHLNHQYLSALFKQETGQTFSDYVTQCRMAKAKRLLRETNLKIYEIASLCGYASAKHFMSVFKEMVGATPGQYREQRN